MSAWSHTLLVHRGATIVAAVPLQDEVGLEGSGGFTPLVFLALVTFR
jgi:hypothetical protein